MEEEEQQQQETHPGVSTTQEQRAIGLEVTTVGAVQAAW